MGKRFGLVKGEALQLHRQGVVIKELFEFTEPWSRARA